MKQSHSTQTLLTASQGDGVFGSDSARYRYYISGVLVQGRKEAAGSAPRVAAPRHRQSPALARRDHGGVRPRYRDVLSARKHERARRAARMTLSLAFIAPDIIEAVANGTLPRGFGISRLTEPPISWAEQRQKLGLPAQS